jgi:putative tricarboxylic transport membrane protein
VRDDAHVMRRSLPWAAIHGNRKDAAHRAATIVNWWKNLDKSEVVAAGLLIGLGVFIITQASNWQYLTVDGPGPGFFPLWIGIVMSALAALVMTRLVIDAIRRTAAQKVDWKGTGGVLATWAGLAVAIALLKPAGFIASFLLFTIYFVMVTYRRSFLVALAVGLGSSVGFWVLFVKLLRVQLPAGPWGF